jgi:hypothetical protein
VYTRNFLRGFGRAVDLRGALRPHYARRATPSHSDAAAIESDWAAVWGDLGQAFTAVRQRQAGAATDGG